MQFVVLVYDVYACGLGEVIGAKYCQKMKNNLKKAKEASMRFELMISCLLDRRFNQLSHEAC